LLILNKIDTFKKLIYNSVEYIIRRLKVGVPSLAPLSGYFAGGGADGRSGSLPASLGGGGANSSPAVTNSGGGGGGAGGDGAPGIVIIRYLA